MCSIASGFALRFEGQGKEEMVLFTGLEWDIGSIQSPTAPPMGESRKDNNKQQKPKYAIILVPLSCIQMFTLKTR